MASGHFFSRREWYALIAIAVWASLYMRGISPFGSLPPYLWHRHEMLFSFATAHAWRMLGWQGFWCTTEQSRR